jgi:subtilase family serine protease
LVFISASPSKQATNKYIAIEEDIGNFVNYHAFYMFWKQFDFFPLGLAL